MQAPSGSPSMHFLAHPLPCSCPSSSHLSSASLPISFFHILPFSFFLFVPTPSPPPHLVSLSSSACFSCLSTVKIGVPHNGAAVCPTPIPIFIRRFFCRTLGICHAFLFMLGNCHTLVGFLSQADWEFVTPAVLAWDFVTFRLLPTGKLSRTHWGFVTLLLGVCHEFNTLTVVFQSVSHLHILLFLY